MSKKRHFKIENEPQTWDEQFITGSQVRAIPPGIPDNLDLYVKRQGKPGALVQKNSKIDLDEPGIEKFYSQAATSTAG